jgi:hypothetical protein
MQTMSGAAASAQNFQAMTSGQGLTDSSIPSPDESKFSIPRFDGTKRQRKSFQKKTGPILWYRILSHV